MKFCQFLIENKIAQFSNWKLPTDVELVNEYHREYETKNAARRFMEPLQFWDAKEFVEYAKKNYSVSEITKQIDQHIDYRSSTGSFEELHRLIQGYSSYPKLRNEGTLRAIYDGFENGNPMTMPIVLVHPQKGMRVFSGNTRMDVAFQLGINPTVMLIGIKVQQH